MTDATDPVDVFFCRSRLRSAAYGMLLADPNKRFVSFDELNMEKSDIRNMLEMGKRPCEYDKEITVTDSGMQLSDKVPNGLIPYLLRQTIYLIAPVGYITMPIDFDDLPHGKHYFESFYNRYVSRSGYNLRAMKLFEKLIGKLTCSQAKTPTAAAYREMQIMFAFSYENRHAVRSIISGLISGKVSCGDKVTDKFDDKNVARYLTELLNAETSFPHLAELKHGSLRVASDFLEDETIILPYIFPLIYFSFVKLKTKFDILYSCL